MHDTLIYDLRRTKRWIKKSKLFKMTSFRMTYFINKGMTSPFVDIPPSLFPKWTKNRFKIAKSGSSNHRLLHSKYSYGLPFILYDVIIYELKGLIWPPEVFGLGQAESGRLCQTDNRVTWIGLKLSKVEFESVWIISITWYILVSRG